MPNRFSPIVQPSQYQAESLQSKLLVPMAQMEREQNLVNTAQDQVFSVKGTQDDLNVVNPYIDQFKQRRDDIVDEVSQQGWNPQAQAKLRNLQKEWNQFTTQGLGYYSEAS